MSNTSRPFSKKTKRRLERLIDKIIEVAAEGNAPFASQVVDEIEVIVKEGN